MSFDEYLRVVAEYASGDADPTLEEEAREHMATGPINYQRMSRIARTFSPAEETREIISRLRSEQLWMVLSEPWCSDSAQCVPVIHLVAACSPLVTMRILLRDENSDIMNATLTDKKRSIPKVVSFSTDGGVFFMWGPRPAAAARLTAEMIADGMPKEQRLERLHLWYGRDRGVSVEAELRALVAQSTAGIGSGQLLERVREAAAPPGTADARDPSTSS
jgi:hypothetical protein